VGPVDRGVGVDGADENLDLGHDARLLILVGTHNGERSRSLTWQHTRKQSLWEFTMEKNNSADSWFNFKPMVGGRITSGVRKHKLFNEVHLVIGDFELSSQFKKIEATNLVKRTIIICYIVVYYMLSTFPSQWLPPYY